MQVEVPGGRGRPSTIVDKDEGLGKVPIVSQYIYSILCAHIILYVYICFEYVIILFCSDISLLYLCPQSIFKMQGFLAISRIEYTTILHMYTFAVNRSYYSITLNTPFFWSVWCWKVEEATTKFQRNGWYCHCWQCF